MDKCVSCRKELRKGDEQYIIYSQFYRGVKAVFCSTECFQAWAKPMLKMINDAIKRHNKAHNIG